MITNFWAFDETEYFWSKKFALSLRLNIFDQNKDILEIPVPFLTFGPVYVLENWLFQMFKSTWKWKTQEIDSVHRQGSSKGRWYGSQSIQIFVQFHSEPNFDHDPPSAQLTSPQAPSQWFLSVCYKACACHSANPRDYLSGSVGIWVRISKTRQNNQELCHILSHEYMNFERVRSNGNV